MPKKIQIPGNLLILVVNRIIFLLNAWILLPFLSQIEMVTL